MAVSGAGLRAVSAGGEGPRLLAGERWRAARRAAASPPDGTRTVAAVTPARARSRGIAYQLGREPKTASRMSLMASSSSSIAWQTLLDAR